MAIVTKYLYKLTIGNNISAPTTELPPLVLQQGEAKSFVEELTHNVYSIILKGVKLNRRIYQPGEIEVELDFMPADTNEGKTPPSIDSVTGLLHNRLVTLSYAHVNQDVDAKKWLKEGNTWTLAENYYVHELNHQLQRDTNGVKLCVKLSIYSLDKLMTLNKYSKAYVARKLGSGILVHEGKNFGFEAGAKTPLMKTNTSSMRFLRYDENMSFVDKAGEMQIATISSEFIHPYLVQYNETFYDFMVRTANRYGEFLYYEDGQLNLGLVDSGDPITIDQYVSVTTQKVTDGPIQSEYYARDSVKNGKGKMNELNFTAIDRENDGFPKDIFTENLKYNSEVAADDFIFPIYKDKFSSWLYQKYWDGTATEVILAKGLPVIADLLGNTAGGVATLGALGAKQALGDEAAMSVLAEMTSGSTNTAGLTEYMEPYKNKPEQYDGNKAVQFASLDEKGWTTVDYYGTIHCREQAQEQKTICINMGTGFIPVKLGQKIKVSGLSDTYVVIQIQQVSDEVWGSDFEKFDDRTSDIYAGQQSMKIYAIPAFKDEEDGNKEKFYPPVQPVPVIRRCGPQTAFIIDNNDPKKQGRVRVAYPWQSLNTEAKENETQARTALKEIQDKKTSLSEKLTMLKKQEGDLKLEKEVISDYLKLTKEQREEADKKDEEDLKRLQEKRSRAEKELWYKQQQIEDIKAADMNPKEKQEILDRLEVEKEAMQKAVLEEQVEAQKKEFETIQQKIDKLEERIARKKAAAEAQEENPDMRIEDNPVYKGLQDESDKVAADKKDILTEQEKADQNEKTATIRLAKAKEILEKELKDISTPWIRVATPMATPGGGTYFKPQLGDEVLINYDNDNVERPYVVGSFFSKNNIVPEDQFYRFYNGGLNKANVSMTMMSPNGHHIAFVDPPSGLWNFVLGAVAPGLGFFGPIAANTVGLSGVGKNIKALGGGIHIGDRYGMYEISMASHKRNITIKSPFGDVSIGAFSGISISAPNGDVKIEGKNITLEAGNKIEVKAGKNVPAPSIGAPKGTWTSTGYAISGGIEAGVGVVNDMFISSNLDFSLIRHIVEIFVRPVEGTLLLKSRKYLKLEGGLGRAMIQKNKFKKIQESEDQKQQFFKVMLEGVDHISACIDNIIDDYCAKWENAFNKMLVYESLADGVVTNVGDPNIKKIAYDKLNASEPWSADAITLATFEGKFVAGQVNKGDNGEKHLTTPEEKFNYIKAAVLEYGEACYDLYCRANIAFPIPPVAPQQDNWNWVRLKVGHFKDTDYIAKQWAIWKETFNDGKEAFLATPGPENEKDVFRASNRKALKRVMLLTFMHYVAADPNNEYKPKGLLTKEPSKWFAAYYDLDRLTQDEKKSPYYLTTEHWWKHQIDIMDEYIQHKFGRAWFNSLFKHTYEKFWDNFRPLDMDIWDDQEGGKILFSDHEDRTLEFSENDELMVQKDANLYSLHHLKEVLKKF